MENKTAMKQFIEWVENSSYAIHPIVLAKAIELKETTEREQIEKAYHKGDLNGICQNDFNSTDYYQQTYLKDNKNG